MTRWAASLPSGLARELASLRLFPSLELAIGRGLIWIRSEQPLTPDLDRELRKIPGLKRYEATENDRLRMVGSRIADVTLPAGPWSPLRQFSTVSLPPCGPGAETRQKIPLLLARVTTEQMRPPAGSTVGPKGFQADALVTTLEEWVSFATVAATVRLERLRFAVMEDRTTLVLGTPLPGIPGRPHTLSSGVLVPCGWAWSPPVDPSVVRELVAAGPDDLILLAHDHTHQVIRAEQLLPASRSAARLTLAGFCSNG